jgi:N-acetylglucosaminyldiphosphoundecaprenol N-acetyl-beta-D-mannosaminyltransferase
MFERTEILGIQVHSLTLAAALERMDEFAASGRHHQIVTANLDFIRIARRDPAFREVINGADLVVPDGRPLLWASRLAGATPHERVTGVDLVEHGAALAQQRGYRIFLLGAEDGVAAEAARVLTERHPGLQIAGSYAPPFGPLSPEEDAKILAKIRENRPDILFVALGAPRQDLWIRAHRDQLPVGVCVGVGGTFNFIAGRLSRAPAWMQQSGLEWLHRLKQEPRRLWRRYLLGDLPTFLDILASAIGPLDPPALVEP